MVRLSRIYTKTGDDGTTGLGDGQRLPKHHPRIAAYGTVDELSSVLGVVLAGPLDEPWRGWLREIQNDLFDLGADLAVPGKGGGVLRIDARYTARLEELIDELNKELRPLDSFVLAGGTPAAAWMHMARTVCRRAERHVSELMALEGEAERVELEVLKYLNRLSDLFFVLARALNDGGKGDVLWQPGKRQG
jgi:cob(I)alamin adenosyltransferase